MRFPKIHFMNSRIKSIRLKTLQATVIPSRKLDFLPGCSINDTSERFMDADRMIRESSDAL